MAILKFKIEIKIIKFFYQYKQNIVVAKKTGIKIV